MGKFCTHKRHINRETFNVERKKSHHAVEHNAPETMLDCSLENCIFLDIDLEAR